jgi:hypothetical protein
LLPASDARASNSRFNLSDLTLGCSNNYYNHRNEATATVQVMHIMHSDR